MAQYFSSPYLLLHQGNFDKGKFKTVENLQVNKVYLWKTFVIFGISISLFLCVKLMPIKMEETKSSSPELSLTLATEMTKEVSQFRLNNTYFNQDNYYLPGTLKAPAVLVKLKGGLGNQLFEYACSYALARKYGWPLYTIVPSFLLWNKNATSNNPLFQRNFGVKDREFALDKFNIPLNEWNTIKKATWSRIASTLENPIMELDDSQLLLSPYFSPDRVIQLSDIDYCQSEVYFSDYKDEIIELFQPKWDNSEAVRHWTKVIENGGESVAVHVRRGDFLAWAKAVPLSYHKMAMKSIAKMLKGVPLTFFVFSDDIPYVKAELAFSQEEFTQEDFPNGTNLHFVSDPERTTSVQDFYLITRCKHAIIPNSSYGWWAAYLIRNPKKIVIAAYSNFVGVKDGFYKWLYLYLYYPNSWFKVDPFGIFSKVDDRMS